MKKFILPLTAVVVLTLFLCFYVRPHSFLPLASSESICIVQTHPQSDENKTYWISVGSPEYMRLQQVLKRYSYHNTGYTHLSFLTQPQQQANTMYIYSGGNTIAVSAGQHININGTVYAIGFYGSQAAESFMNQILHIAQNSPQQPPDTHGYSV